MPLHKPDILFSRLLQQAARSPEPLSAGLIHALLTHRHFPAILARAIDAMLPLNSEFVSNPEESSNPDWNAFLDRLIYSLARNESFAKFFNSHLEVFSGVGALKSLENLYLRSMMPRVVTFSQFINMKSDMELGDAPLDNAKTALAAFLEDGTRQLLFEAVLEDPECAYVYASTFSLWDSLIAWFKAIDFKKARELWPTAHHTDKGGKGQDVKTLGYIALAVVIFLTLCKAEHPASSDPRPDVRHTLELTPDVKEKLVQLAESVANLSKKVGADQPTPTPVDPTPTRIFVTAPEVNEKLTQLTVNIANLVKAAESLPHTDQTSQPGKCIPICIPPPAATPAITIPPFPQKFEITLPPAIAPPVIGGDQLLSFTNGKDVPLTAPTIIIPIETVTTPAQTSSSCLYTATLLTPGNKWVPDPVRFTLTAAAASPPTCKEIIPEGSTIDAGPSPKPLYSNLLKAYVSIVEAHKRYWKFGHNQLVLMVHFEAPPHA